MAAIATILVFGGWLASAVGGIMILVAAFRESAGQGLMNLLIPFYAFYYVATRWEDCKTGAVVSGVGLIALIIGTISAAGAAVSSLSGV